MFSAMVLNIVACSFIFLLSLEHSVCSSEMSDEESGELSESWEVLLNSLNDSCGSYYADVSREYREIEQKKETPSCYSSVKEKLRAKEGDDINKVEEIFYEMYDSLSYKDQVYIYNCFEECYDKALENVQQSEECKNATDEFIRKFASEWTGNANDASSETTEEDSGELSDSWELILNSLHVRCKSYYEDISREYIEMDVRKEMPHCYTKVKKILGAQEGDDTNKVQEIFYQNYDSLSEEDQDFIYNCLEECYKKVVKNVPRSQECYEAHKEYERKLKELYDDFDIDDERVVKSSEKSSEEE